MVIGVGLNRFMLDQNHTKFFPSRGTPAVLVVRESLVVEGETENLMISPKLITCNSLSKVQQAKTQSDPVESRKSRPSANNTSS